MRFLSRLRSEDRSDSAERRGGHGPARRRAAARPRLEVLEERRVLSTLIVTSSSDGGYSGGSLRDEIAAAQPGDTIVFDPSLDGQTITLGMGQLEINKDLTIQGPGAGLLAISGGGYLGSRVFQVDAGANVTISGLTIEDGYGERYNNQWYGESTGPATDYYDGLGGGILNFGTLALSGCNVTNNSTGSKGGGIYNHGTMTLSGSTVTRNTARDSYDSTNGTVWQKGAGGGIFNDSQGNLTILSSTVVNNTASDGADICDLGTMKVKNSTIGKVSHK